jgi:hypothetical protein
MRQVVVAAVDTMVVAVAQEEVVGTQEEVVVVHRGSMQHIVRIYLIKHLIQVMEVL